MRTNPLLLGLWINGSYQDYKYFTYVILGAVAMQQCAFHQQS